MKIMKKNLFCLIVLFFSLVTVANAATEKAGVLQKCRQFFGQPVDEARNLFEINPQFVLRAKFSSYEELTEFELTPKYYYQEEHPEWEEPNEGPKLSSAEYENLLRKMDLIKSRGKLVWSSKFSIVSNMTRWHGSYYENASMDQGTYPVWNAKGDAEIGYTVRSSTISFISRVEGLVVKKTRPNRKTTVWIGGFFGEITTNTGPVFKVLVESDSDEGLDYSYYVSKATFDKLKLGKKQSFRGALLN